MSDPSGLDSPAGPRTSAADPTLPSGSKSTAPSDHSSEAEDENRPGSPHFYSLSVRQDSPSLESYHADTANSKSKNLDDYEIDDCIEEDLTSDQQVQEQAVKLDLLRREHSQRARQTLEQLQTAASTASQRSESPRRSSFGSKRTSSNVSMDLVRQQSEQLKQASGDLKRLAEEQRTLAEEAVATFLLKEDAMMTEGESKPAGSSPNDAGLSQALNAVFEEQHGSSCSSLTRQMEKIRRAEQAIKDAEADERIADQLAALQLTLSQLADQDEFSNPSEDMADSGDGTKASINSQGTTPGRAILKNISENSQEGLDSSQGRSSSSQQSQMAASAFAAVSQTNGFHGAHDENQEAVSEDQTHQGSLDSDEHSSQDRPAAQDELTAAESAQAEQQTAQHEQHQAQSPEADTDAGADTAQTGAKTAQTDVKDTQNGAAEDSQPFAASNPESEPLTETSLSALRLNTDASQSQAQALPASASGHDHDPAAGSPTAPASQGSGFAGSPAGSHTFDAELHDGIAALVQTPANIDTADHQPSHAPTSTEPDAAGLSIQGLTTPSSLESTSSQQGAEAAQEAAAASDQAPVYSLGSDEEDDLTVVSSKDQAREAQASANHFMESTSRPATPDTDVPAQDPPQQAGPLSAPPSTPADQQEQRQQDESASDSAANVSTYTTSEYDGDARMAGAFEPEEFQGMLFHDGVDSQGRPVIVVNTDAVGTTRKARGQALQYMLHRLEPIVVQGPYVLVMVATGQHQKSNKLPAMWLISAYRNLSRPFRKNVRYILLVRPTGGLKALVTCIRPFVSAKAAKKVRKVDSLAAIAAATSNEVTLQHLGSRFAAAAGNYFLEGVETQSTAASPYNMPHF